MQIQAGQVHAVANVPPEVLPQLRKDPKLSVSISPTNVSMFVNMNNQKKPFNDIRVRQAMNFAVDKEAIARDLFQGLADPISSVIAPIVEGAYQPSPYEYNPEKAKKLLAEAGYPNGFACSLWSPSGRLPKDVELAQLIQRYLGAVGITAKIQIWEWAAFLTEIRQPLDKAKWDIFLMKFAPSTGEARWQLYLCWSSGNLPPKGNNRAFYSNPAFDKLIESGTSAASADLRNKYFREAQVILRDAATSVPLCSPHIINVTSKKLHDFVFSPLEHAYATNKTWLEK